MGGVDLCDDGATGRERGGGIATSDTERKREIGRAKDGNWSDGDHTAIELGTRKRLSVRKGFDESAVGPFSLANVVCEHSELPSRSAKLSGYAWDREMGFSAGDLNDFSFFFRQLCRDCFQ